jgi:hypothetical protein
MIRPGAREALFMDVGRRPISVRVGGEIDGWTIVSIESDRVLLSSAFGERTVEPTNGPQKASSLAIAAAIPAEAATSAAPTAVASVPSPVSETPPFQSVW